MDFKKNESYIELDSFWIRVLIIVLLFETNSSFRFIWWTKNASFLLPYN